MHKRACAIGAVVALLVQANRAVAAEDSLTLHAALGLARAANAPAGSADSDVAALLAGHVPTTVAFGMQTEATTTPQGGGPAEQSIAERLVVDLGSGARRRANAATTSASALAARASLAASRKAGDRATLEAFFAVAGDEVLDASAAENEALARRTLEVAQIRRRLGSAPEVDVERERSTLELVQSERAAAAAALAGDRAILATLVGQAVAAVSLPPAGELPEVGTLRAAVDDQPAVVNAAAARAAAEAELLVARAASRSGVALGAGAAVDKQGRNLAVAPSVTLDVTVPFGSRATQAGIAVARAQAAAAQAAVEQSRRDAFAAFLRERMQAQSAAVRLPGLQAATVDARRVLDAALGGYRLGAVSGSDLLAAQTRFATVRGARDNAAVAASRTAATLALEIGAPL